MGIDVGTLAASAIGLSLWGSAYVSEIARGAVSSIPRGQARAAKVLGMGAMQAVMLVILPQCIQRALPPLVTHTVHMFQNTTLASLVGLTDVLAAANYATGRLALQTGHAHFVAIYGGVGVFFFRHLLSGFKARRLVGTALAQASGRRMTFP